MIFILSEKTDWKAMMMCGIGSKRSHKSQVTRHKRKKRFDCGLWTADRGKKGGFTLVEVLIAAAILAVGIVGITQSYFVTLDLQRVYTDYIQVLPWIDEKIWQAEDCLVRLRRLEGQMPLAGMLVVGRDEYRWRISYALSGPESYLYQIHFALKGTRERRPLEIERTAYALVPQN